MHKRTRPALLLATFALLAPHGASAQRPIEVSFFTPTAVLEDDCDRVTMTRMPHPTGFAGTEIWLETAPNGAGRDTWWKTLDYTTARGTKFSIRAEGNGARSGSPLLLTPSDLTGGRLTFVKPKTLGFGKEVYTISDLSDLQRQRVIVRWEQDRCGGDAPPGFPARSDRVISLATFGPSGTANLADDCDRITVRRTANPAGMDATEFRLETGASGTWWKELKYFPPGGGRDETIRAAENGGRAASPIRPRPEELAAGQLVFVKPKVLGAGTPVYHINGLQEFRGQVVTFSWERDRC